MPFIWLSRRWVALPLLLSACRPDSVDTRLAAGSTDSFGVQVAHLGDLTALKVPEWTSQPLYSTRTSDSLALGRFVDGRFSSETTLVVTRQTELLVLDRQGRLRRTLGRDGAGPGEYRLITRLAIADDGTLLVYDYNALRLTQISPTRPLRIIPYLGRPNGGYEIEPVTLLRDGRILATFWQLRPNRDELGLTVGRFDRDSAPLLVYDSMGAYLSTLGTWPGLERLRSSDARLPPAFARTALVQGRGRHVVISSTDSVAATLFTGAVPALRLTATQPHRAPTSALIRAWERAMALDMADVADVYLRVLRGTPTVPALPVLDGIGVDEHGNVWLGSVGLPNDTLRTWTVVSPTGTPLGRLSLPARPTKAIPGHRELLDVFGGQVALLREAPDGELYVEVRAIHPSAQQ